MKIEKSPAELAVVLSRMVPPEVFSGLVVAGFVLAGVWFVSKHVIGLASQ